MNIKLSYMYRCYGNYKNHGHVILSNPEGLTIAEIKSQLSKKLLDDTWFYASRWHLPDLHFKDYDDELDHPFHELEDVEYTDEAVTREETVVEFIGEIVGDGWPS